MTMKPAELVADIDRRVRALERTRAALGGGGSGTYLPLAGGTMTGTLTGAGGTFTSLSVNGSAVTTASSLATELASYVTSSSLATTLSSYATTSSLSSYLPLAGGSITGTLGVHGPLEVTDTGVLNLKGTDSSTYPNSLNFYSGSNFWHWSGPRTGQSNEMHAYWYNGSSYTVALKLHTSGAVTAGSTLSAPRVNTDIIGAVGGDDLGIGAGETANYMAGNISGEHLWLGAEGNTYLVTSPDNWASGWAGRYTTTLTPMAQGHLRISSNHGYVDIGPQNTSWLHIYTDRGGVYFNKKVSMAASSQVRGLLTVDNEVRVAVGSSGAPSLSFISDSNTGLYRVANGQLGVSCNGVVHTFKNDGLHLASGDWFRSYGNAGWYSQTYGGGWYMIDTTWLRTYNNKRIYSGSGIIRTDSTGAFEMPNATTTWSYNTVRYNTSNGQLMPYASLGSMKTDITEVQPLLDYLGERSLLYDLRPVIFREADDRTDADGNPVTTTRGEYAPGFIAEEVHDVAPELTFHDRHGDLISYAPDALVPHVVAELQRLMPMVETLWQAHDPSWTPPTPRPAERAAAERAVYEAAAEYARTHPIEDPNATVPDDFEDPAAELEVLEDEPTEPTQEDDQPDE